MLASSSGELLADMTAVCNYCVVIAVAVSATFLSSQKVDA